MCFSQYSFLTCWWWIVNKLFFKCAPCPIFIYCKYHIFRVSNTGYVNTQVHVFIQLSGGGPTNIHKNDFLTRELLKSVLNAHSVASSDVKKSNWVDIEPENDKKNVKMTLKSLRMIYICKKCNFGSKCIYKL